jgi:hypothetical protein
MGCGAPAAPTNQDVTYSVTGTATSSAGIEYTGSGNLGFILTVTALPWSANVGNKFQPGDALSVSAQNKQESGCLTAQITRGSRVLRTETECGSFVSVTASATY